MNDERTTHEKALALAHAVIKCNAAGWEYISPWHFASPTTGKVKDLSASNLDLLNIHPDLS